MPTLDKLLKTLQDGRALADEIHLKAAKNLLAGKCVYESLKDAGYAENTAQNGKAAISGPIRKAMQSYGFHYQVVGNVMKADPEQIKDVVLGFLYTALVQRSSKGVNAAKLLGSIREIDMFAKPEITQNNVIINAPPDFNPAPKEAKPREAPKALPPSEAPDVDYE